MTTNSPMAPYAPPSTYAVPGMGGGGIGYSPAMMMQVPTSRNLPTLLGLLNALKRRWVLASFLGLLAGLAAAAGVWLALPTGKHQVRALVEVQPERKLLDNSAQFDNNFESYKKNQETLIKLRPMLEKVAKDRTVQQLPFIRSNDDPAKWIEDQIKLSWQNNSDILAVSMNGDNPEQLRIVLQALVLQYADDAGSGEKKARADSAKQLNEHKADLIERIKKTEARVMAQSKAGAGTKGSTEAIITQLTKRLEALDNSINDLEKKLLECESKMKYVQARMSQIDTETVDSSLFDEEVRKDPTSSDLWNRYQAAERAYSLAKDTSKVEALYAQKKQVFEEAKVSYEQHVAKAKSGIDAKIRGEAKQKLIIDLRTQQQLKESYEALLSRERESRETTEKRIEELNRGGIIIQFDLDDLAPEKETLVTLNRQLLQL
ncbi:MAG: hypothetical protein ACRCZF_19725, partial [Gemmataceae bacterium]